MVSPQPSFVKENLYILLETETLFADLSSAKSFHTRQNKTIHLTLGDLVVVTNRGPLRANLGWIHLVSPKAG